MRSRIPILGATLVMASGCHDGPTDTSRRSAVDARPGTTAHAADASSTSSVRWNRRAVALFRARGGDVCRINSYLSIAQYRAVLAAQDERHGRSRPSPAAAAAGASVVVLKQFYPLDASAIDAQLEAQRAESPLGSESNADFALLRETCFRAVDEHVPHRDRRQREKVGPIAPGNSRLIDELQVGFVNETGRRQRAASLTQCQLPARNHTEVLVHDRHEAIEAISPPASKLLQDIHIRRLCFHLTGGAANEALAPAGGA